MGTLYWWFTDYHRFLLIFLVVSSQIMQLNELLEKDEMLRKVIQGMLENGMSLDAIAEMLNKTVDEVKQIEG